MTLKRRLQSHRKLALVGLALLTALASACLPGELGGNLQKGDGGSQDGGGPFGGDGGAADLLDLNDVTMLFPLPALGHEGDLLPMTEPGSDPMYSKQLYDILSKPADAQLNPNGRDTPLIPPAILSASGFTLDDVYDTIRVVGVRFDPCNGVAPLCKRQIRLVAQPIGEYEEGFLEVVDAAVHLFFDFDAVEWNQIHRELWQLKALAGLATSGQPLKIHPSMQSQGLKGAYAQSLKTILKNHCRGARLTRVALMQTGGPKGQTWTFRTFDFANGLFANFEIPKILVFTQSFDEASDGANTPRSGTMNPAPAGENLGLLLQDANVTAGNQTSIRQALTEAIQIENPDHPTAAGPMTTPDHVDCVSCHVASRSRRFAENKLSIDNSAHPDLYAAPSPRFNLSRLDTMLDDARGMRALGYFPELVKSGNTVTGINHKTALSQRVINESANVAHALSQNRNP